MSTIPQLISQEFAVCFQLLPQSAYNRNILPCFFGFFHKKELIFPPRPTLQTHVIVRRDRGAARSASKKHDCRGLHVPAKYVPTDRRGRRSLRWDRSQITSFVGTVLPDGPSAKRNSFPWGIAERSGFLIYMITGDDGPYDRK